MQANLFEKNGGLTLSKLESHLWEAANILRGNPGDRTGWKSYILPLLFFKRICDVWDEEQAQMVETYGEDFADEHRFQVPEECHWTAVRETPTNVGTAMSNALRGIERANQEHLYGVFGDAPWTNKDRLPDDLLKDLIEHFSALPLGNKSVRNDVIGDAYEYLIKQFADATNKKAGEFYTPHSVVRLMADILDPQEGETIYDPACGTGGMLLSALAEVKRAGDEHRTLRLYGQERNHMTSSIARMNLVLHGVEDFDVQRGDTLEWSCFIEGDRLRTFNVVLANPPYSIKRWNREAWSSDAWGRNFLGTPPQGRADYAFFQHILKSMDPQTGRCAILFPHGMLFRKEETEMRRKLVEADLVECVLGLGPNLFFNSPMEACVVFCRARKAPDRRGRILFIDAVEEITRERAYSYLKDEHQRCIREAFDRFENEPGFAAVANVEQVVAQGHRLSIPLFVQRSAGRTNSDVAPPEALMSARAWRNEGLSFWGRMDTLVERLSALGGHDA